MPPVAAEPPDTEVLDGTPFMSGGWPDESIALDLRRAGFSQVAEALGDGVMLESDTPETLLAAAFAAGDCSRLLKITPMQFVGEWEAAIDDRAGLEDVGAPTDNAYIDASAAANTAARRCLRGGGSARGSGRSGAADAGRSRFLGARGTRSDGGVVALAWRVGEAAVVFDGAGDVRIG